jgi:uncharacterized YigZ family protein
MAVFNYHTIQSPAEGLYKEKGSRFLAFAFPAGSDADIREKLSILKKKYYDARHHCYAWMLGPEQKLFRAFDDGEPNHSAGDPILGQIRSYGLTDVLIVVVRYFGGVKLGVGGLISAYKLAAESAIKNAVIIEKEVMKKMKVTYAYSSTPDVMRFVKEFNLIIHEQSFSEQDCYMDFMYRLKDEKPVNDKLALMQATGVSIRAAEADIK